MYIKSEGKNNSKAGTGSNSRAPDREYLIEGKRISFSYDTESGTRQVLRDISFQIKAGELTAILGANGCGKTTLLRLINGLLPLQTGQLRAGDFDLGDRTKLWALRRQCAMVFQNPDHQFVSDVVAEDVAFGLRNYQIPDREIPERVEWALTQVGLEGFGERNTHTLSGGQKQRAALAGALALRPAIFLLDEVTSMLDPRGRDEVLDVIRNLREQSCTILMVTHSVEEAALADKILLLGNGSLLACGHPREILTDAPLLRSAALDVPLTVQLYHDLLSEGIALPFCPITKKEFAESLCNYH